MSGPAVPPPLPPPISVAAAAVPAVRRDPAIRDLAIALAIIWCCNILLQVVGFGSAMALEFARTGKVSDITESAGILFTLVLLDWVVALPIAYYFSCARYGKSIREGFGLIAVPAGVVSRSFSIGFGGAVVAAVVMSLFATGDAPIYDIAMEESGDGPPTLMIGFMLFAILVPPLEELYYRGFIFPILRRSLSPKWAIAIVSLWFTLLHAPQLMGEWAGLAMIVVMGTIWTVQRHVHDSLTPCIISHWTYNTSLIVLQVVAGI